MKPANENERRSQWSLWLGLAAIAAWMAAQGPGLPTSALSALAVVLAAGAGFSASGLTAAGWTAGPAAVGESEAPAWDETASAFADAPGFEDLPTNAPDSPSPAAPPLARDFSAWSQDFGSHFENSRDSVRRVNELVQTGVNEVGNSFGDIHRLIQQQQNSLREVLDSMSQTGGEATEASIRTLNQDLAATANALNGFARLVIQVSKLNMDVYFQVEDMAAELNHIGQLVDGVESVAKQTALLALNASIEAAHVGAAGRTFQVVADEIRALAQRTRQISDDIRGSAGSVQVLVRQAQTAARRSASQDMSALLGSKTQLDTVRVQMESLDRRIGARMDEVSEISTAIGTRTGSAVRSLQFEDISRQILEHVDADLMALSTTLRELGDEVESSGGEADLRARSVEILAGKREMAPHLPGQSELSAGEIELF